MRAFVATLLLALPLAAADTGPAASLQTAPLGRLLKDVREAATIVAGEMGSKAIDDGLKTALGEKGFSGLDLGKPLLGYVIFDAKDAELTRFVLMVPIAKEDDFMDFLKRCQLEPEEHKDAKGVYKLGNFDIPADKPMEFEVLMRINGSTAYVGFNVKPDALAADKVFKPEQVADANEKALLTYRQFNDRIAPEVLKNNLKSLEENMKKIQDAIGGAGAPEKAILGSLEKLMTAMTKLSFDAKETGSRLSLDTASGELSLDSYYVPKPGSEFAKSLTERKPTTNQFAGVAGKETAAGLMVQLPVGMKEMQDLMLAGVDALKEKAKEDPLPPFAKDMFEEGMACLARTVKSGTWDLGAALNGPDKDGHFTFIGGITFEDTKPFEKALKANFKDFPAEARNVIKLDVDTVADLDMHAIDPPQCGEPEGYARIFGDRKVYFVFAPKALYVAVGNGAKDALKAAILGKPGPANAFDITINPKRMGQVVTAIEPNAGAMAEKIMGTEDKSHSAISFSVTGGDALRFRMSLNLKILPRFIFQGVTAFGG